MITAPKFAEPWHGLPMFTGIPTDALEALGETMDTVTFSAGTRILTQDLPGDYMYVVTDGRVRVHATGGMDSTHFEVILKAPAVIGEMALVTHEPRTATVDADTDVTALRASMQQIEALLEHHPKASHILTTIVGRRLLEANTIRKVGHYEVRGRLGKGAMATVFEGVQANLKRPVALKMLSHRLAKRRGFAEHFKSEARRIASLDHENIVKVYDTVQGYGTHFIVMERMTGHGLDEVIKSKTRLDYNMIRRVVREICAALAYSHSTDLLHRDIKPSNIFITAGGKVKLLDFGIAVETERSATKGGKLAGTPYYMAPEQIRGLKLDGRADLYATALLAYQLVTLKLPFDATSLEYLYRQHIHTPMPDPLDIQPDVPEDLCEFIRINSSKRRDDRHPSCEAAGEFLAQASTMRTFGSFDMATVSIAYHPNRGDRVRAALQLLDETLTGVDGVKVEIHGEPEG